MHWFKWFIFCLDKVSHSVIQAEFEMASKYRSDLQEATTKLSKMLEELEALQTRIAKQKRRVAALAELADGDEDSELPSGLVTGITDAVRTVFFSAEKPLSVAEVKARVEALGIPPQQNLLASVHTVIRRLREAGEIEPVGDLDFGGGFRRIKLIDRVKTSGELLPMRELLGEGRGLPPPPERSRLARHMTDKEKK